MRPRQWSRGQHRERPLLTGAVNVMVAGAKETGKGGLPSAFPSLFIFATGGGCLAWIDVSARSQWVGGALGAEGAPQPGPGSFGR